MSSSPTEGYATFSHEKFPTPSQTWYQIHGPLTPTTRPLIILHGGPGATHNYLTPITRLHTTHNRTIILYDQIGCGNSTRYRHKRLDATFWTIDLFIAELNNLLTHLNITTFDLLGHSWGGMFAAEYAMRQLPHPPSSNLHSIIISNSPASMNLWVSSCNEWRAALPPATNAILTHHETTQTYDAQPYKDAVLEFYKRHMCRVRHPDNIQPFPECVMAMMRALDEDDTVYFTMNGPSEFTVIGSLKEWSAIGRLERVKVPTLVVSGEFDEAREVCVEPYKTGIVGAEWVVMEGASHCAVVERTEEYCALVDGWLRRQEGS